jgi:hypothetical protein
LTGASGGAAALQHTGASGKVLNNRVKGGQAVGILCQSTTAVVGNVIFNSGGLNISMNSTAGSPLIYGNTVVGGTTDGIDILTGTTGLQCVVNNIITDNGGYAVDANNFGCQREPPGTSRFPDFHQLDVRVDRSWLFDNFTLNLYLDVQNVYYAKNIETYFTDYRCREEIPVPGIPVLPVLGLKGTF